MTQDRTIIAVTGTDREEFLQGLVTNDIARERDGLAYTALLTPQGKLIADFFVKGEADRLLIDVDLRDIEHLHAVMLVLEAETDVAEIRRHRDLSRAP